MYHNPILNNPAVCTNPGLIKLGDRLLWEDGEYCSPVF